MSTCIIVPALHPERTVQLMERLEGTCEAAIVIDNSCGPVAAKLARSAPWVTVVVPEQNLGFGIAVDLAARRAREEFLVILNDDVMPRPGFVSAIIAPFEDPDVHQVSALLLVAGEARIDTVGLAFDRTLRGANVRELVEGRPKHAVIGPSGAAAAYRRSSYCAAGGYAPELVAYWEDADLALRFWAAGHRCVFARDAVAEHVRGLALGGRSPRQRELDAFGRGFLLGRYRAWLSLIDRLAVPLVDWPSIVRSCIVTRSLCALRARRAGLASGRRSQFPNDAKPIGSPAARPIRETLFVQLRGARAGESLELDTRQPVL